MTESTPRVPAVELPVATDPRRSEPLDSVALEAEYLDILEDLDGDAPSHEAGDAYLAGTNALYHGGPVQWSFVPKVFSPRDLSYLAWIAETMGGIMDKLTRAFADDPALRAAFGMDPVIEELASAGVPYASPIPIARVDIFLDEQTGDFKFCELNTDGSSGMLVTEEVTRANLLTATGRRFAGARDVRAFDIYGELVDAVLACYREAGGDAPEPRVVAVDYAESIVREEIADVARAFRARGARLDFADIRSLAYEGGALRDDRGPIDCVWRRVVISEMLEKPCEGADALMACARAGEVPIVGGFCTWPCATKTVFSVLASDLARAFLDDAEIDFVRRHVPATHMLDRASDLGKFADRELWIAKPRDGYNSVGVRAGRDCTAAEWDEVLREMAATGGTVQEYVVPYASPNVEGGVAGIGRAVEPYMNMEGLFLFRNRFAGVFTRCGQASVIGEFAGRLNMGCLVAS